MTNKLPNSSRPYEYSQDTETLLDQNKKKQQVREGANDTDLTDIRKQISKSIRKDRRKHEAEMIGPDLDIRDQFIGLQHLRKPYVPIPLSMKDAQGQHVPLHKRAQCAATFLGDQIWGEAHAQPETLIEQIATERLVTDELGLKVSDITLAELEGAIRKLKRGKAAGPDGIPVDIFKELDLDGLMILQHLLNDWWNGKEIPIEVTQAQVVLIFKKRKQGGSRKLPPNLTAQRHL